MQKCVKLHKITLNLSRTLPKSFSFLPINLLYFTLKPICPMRANMRSVRFFNLLGIKKRKMFFPNLGTFT